MGSPDTTAVVSLRGRHFRDVDDLACLVDGLYVVPSQFVDATLIRCSLPPYLDAGAVSVALVLDGVPISTGPPLYFTFLDLSVNSIRPAFGDVTGGTAVVFNMKNETLGSGGVVSHCVFGEEIAPAVVRQSDLVCVSPPAPGPGSAVVGVSINGVDFSTSHLAFEYTERAVFSSMHPTSGSETGGTPVKLSGANFVSSNRAACYFGNIAVAGRWVSDEILACETPPMKPGNYKVRVSLNGVDTLRTSWHFTFFKEIDVVYASPSSGSILGGTEVSIIGKSFVSTESLSCQFGEWGTVGATFISSTKLSCLTPDISKEAYDLVDIPESAVHVSLNGVDVSSAAARFRFTRPAIVHGIHPDRGTVGGGTVVTVKGANLSPALASNSAVCMFGNETVPASPASSEEMTCVAPPHSVDEAVFFAVSLNAVDLVGHGEFCYLPTVKTVSIKPSGGPFTGGTLVTVKGIDFDKSSVANCKFGSLASDGIVYISDEAIQCMSPPHPPGTATFGIITEGDDITFSDVAFEFYKPPTILFSHPASGPHHGGTVVRIYGRNFRSNAEYLCYFGLLKAPVPASYVDADAIECSSPRSHTNSEQSEVDLRVAEKSSNFTANALRFSYVPSATLDYLRPKYALFEGGNTISIYGNHQNTTGHAWCRFILPPTGNDEGHYFETAQANLYDGHVDCQVPAYPLANEQVEAFVEVSTNDWDWSDSRLSFVYAPKPEIHAIHPALGSVNGGTVVTIRGAGFVQGGNLGCSFGGTVAVPAAWRSPEEISCAAPAMPYAVNTTISLHFEESPQLIEGPPFTYVSELSLGEASPMRGFVGGGTVVTVQGTGFLDVPTLSCHFGSVKVLATFMSFNSIKCVSPSVNQGHDVELKVSLNGMDASPLSMSRGRRHFRYDKDIDLFHTIPRTVPLSGANAGMGCDIAVMGRFFINTTSLSCRFGKEQLAVAQYISASEVRCILREVTEIGENEVRISLNGVDFSRKKTSVFVVEPALISSVSPQRVQEGHAVEILVQGEHFLRSSDLRCHFGLRGNLWSPARWISDSSLKCTTPSFNLTHDGIEYVGVSNNGGYDSGRQLFALEVTPRVRFLSMHPTVGYVGGGTEVTITLGLGNVKYMEDLMCQFESQATPAKILTANSVACESPPHHPAEVTVKLISDRVQVLARGTFFYIKPPIVETLEPASGTPGTAVSFYGKRLGGVTHCRFGINGGFKTVPAIESDPSFTCTTPDLEENGEASVEITHNGEDFVGGHVFTYQATPRLLSIEPAFGGDMGGKVVYITGENFIDTLAMCRFGFDSDKVVSALYISPTLLSCVAPPLKIGLAPVFVSLNQVDFVGNTSLAYESIKLPQIQSVDPVLGTVNGITSVVLKTTKLYATPDLACHFGEETAPATYLSPHSASCVAPTIGAPSVVNISMSIDGEGGPAETNSVEFTYVPEPRVLSVSPNFGWIRTAKECRLGDDASVAIKGGEDDLIDQKQLCNAGGSQLVHISMKDFTPFHSHEISCSFGDSSNFIKASRVKDDVVSCSLPQYDDTMKQRAPILLQVAKGNNTFHINTPVFTYLAPAIVTSVSPPIGSTRGGVRVRVSGVNFPNMFRLSCLFGDVLVDAEFSNKREMYCILPEWKGGPKKVDVTIGIKGASQLTVISHASFEYRAHPTFKELTPKFGSTHGGTRVSIRGTGLAWPEASHYLSCRFGNSTLMPVQVQPSGEDELVCISPPLTNDARVAASEKNAVPVSLYANHGQLWLASSEDEFTYVDHVLVGALSPSSGPVSGGTVVTLPAEGLHHLPIEEITCHFDDTIVPASYSQVDNVLKCVSPPISNSLSQKMVMLNLGVNGLRDIASVGQVFTYYPAATVNSVFPSIGFLEGGENVFVSGHNFRNDVELGCKFAEYNSPRVVWISDTSIICTSPRITNKANHYLNIKVTNNGMDYSGPSTAAYLITHRPDVSKVEPSVVSWEESTSIRITGKNLMRVSACQFGDINETYPTFNITKNSIWVKVPPATDAPLSFLPSLSRSKIPIFLHLENGMFASGLGISYAPQLPPEAPPALKSPTIDRIHPAVGSAAGGDWIRVHGKDFLNTVDLSCKFGDSRAHSTEYISSSEVRCKTPRHLPQTVSFDVFNSDSRESQNTGFQFTFVPDLSIQSIHPAEGSVNGGTAVRIFGSFPPSLIELSELDSEAIKCKFGMSSVVAGVVQNQNEVTCLCPPSSMPEAVEVRLSFDGGINFANSSIWFSYEYEEEIVDLVPNYGVGNSSIVVVGRNFRNSTGFHCLFGQRSASAIFISRERVSCAVPQSQTGMDNKVALRLAHEGGIGSSWKHFEYIERPEVTSFDPAFGEAGYGKEEVIVRGSGFRPTLQLMCAFGKIHVRATVVSTSKLRCRIPRHPPGAVDFHIIDQHALFAVAPTKGIPQQFIFVPEASVYSINPSWNMTFARGINFDTRSMFGLRQSYSHHRSLINATVVTGLENKNEVNSMILLQGSIQSGSPVTSQILLSAPNGTMARHNITLCEPGTFKPQNGEGQCLRCPVGYMCPLFGLSKPMLCPAGTICERLGLVVPSSLCTDGHYCEKGTKMSFHIANTTTETWLLEEETGLLTTVMTNSAWDYIPRIAPATGKRRISHPPMNARVKAQQPFPCPIGFFCREGRSPTPCTDGYFCPRGSISPEGTGGCPAGFYCPTSILAIPCDIGHYCPGIANTSPLPCQPGSYSSTTGQIYCNLCEVGFQCPGPGRATPELCQAGWVCDEEGLSIPSKRCPSGFVCREGTTTADPYDPNPVGVPPTSCPQGSFCLEGVAHNTTSSWLPSLQEGISHPQGCLEGYFCPSNSSTPFGGGPCWEGHYCPENSPYPVQTPPGAFAGADGGAIIGSLCLPGTYSPRPGQVGCSPCPAGSSCLSYGTYVPRICGPGTYRSREDSTQCKPCPERTYSFASGSTDISQCLPCAEGRVCGSQGMTDLKQSNACSEGNVCGYLNNRVTQFSNQCPSGYYCGNATASRNQYLNQCPSGHHCPRGSTLKTRDKCGKSHYCTPGTPHPEPLITRCPRQTTSSPGAKDMDFCSPSFVAICDKMPMSKTNPFDPNPYYPLEHVIGTDEESAEMLVIDKVLPFNEVSPNVSPWKNDTVEVFRTCPAYGVRYEKSSEKLNLTVIGRNFLNSTTLTCRYRICLGSSWETPRGAPLIIPGLCREITPTLTNLGEPVVETGTYISSTRVVCPMPDFAENSFRPINASTAINTATQFCMHDATGQVFLSQECSGSDLASGRCAFEDAIPSFGVRKRIYSLTVPCSKDEVLNGLCGDVPVASSKLNPCLTQRMVVDISNSGKKFSSDVTITPYTSVESFGAGDTHQILPTFAFFEFVPERSLSMLQRDSSVITKKHLMSSFDNDAILCRRSLAREEGHRLGEDGWFESPYMSRFHLSFDWRHLPSYLVYDEHFKLAIFVRPSRCQESKCSDFGRSHIYEENIPCLQPLELPIWFTDGSVDKNQIMNMTLTSLDDSLFRVEVQIVNGLALPTASFFKNTMTVVMEHPKRASTRQGKKRRMSPFVSWEEKATDNHMKFGIRYDEGNSQQVSLPRNLPPRWKSFERGRVLLGMNTTHENPTPTIKDGHDSRAEGKDFWDNPYQSAIEVKRQSDIYFETFHGVSQDGLSYRHDSLILPYLPFFSNCREFDSHVPLWALVESSTDCRLPGVTEEFPEDWWRRGIPPLPHQDDVKAIGPSDFVAFYPVADWCERHIHCSFEEDLPKPEVTPRWFEADSGTALFSIIRDPIDYHQFTGRDSSTAGENDGGGQRFINSIDTLQTFIPARVDRSPSLYVEGGCTTECYPRKVTIDIAYYQVDVYSKRIVEVKVLYDKFDKDSSNDRYDLRMKFYALNYQELVIKFAFSRGLFLLLFTQIGAATVLAAFLYWVVVRLTTQLERPPGFRITGFLYLTFPPALGGFLLGLMPISIVTTAVYYLMKGYLVFTPDADPEGRRWLFPSSTRLHYSRSTIDPLELQSTRQGRTGLAFVTIALISLYYTSRMFVPKGSSNISASQVNWKRGNLICSSVVMSLFLVVIVEWSFWGSFGTYIWEAIIFMKILSIFVGSIVDKQLGEALLSAPVMTAMGLAQGIVTMSAVDFMDFLLSYIVGFGFLILERMYLDGCIGWIQDVLTNMFKRLQSSYPSVFGGNREKATSSKSEDEPVPDDNNETVEPLLGSYASYSCDTLSLLYTPFIMLIIMAFRDEAEITKLYGIKEADMEYYVLFALAIIPFQILADCCLHNALELLHGWKIYAYLEYCRVRFQQREVWWKGFETNTLDECIEESLRSMDQWCFSNQYYACLTVHVNGMIYFVMGVEMMARAKYIAFGDPAMFPIIGIILLCSIGSRLLLIWIARILRFWRIKHEKREWHSKVKESEGNPNMEHWDDVQLGHDQHVMEQKITDETFRYKFLNYNRSWILSQLPDMLTPRTTADQRPYMINQFARILGQVSGDASSDSDSDDGPEFVDAPVASSTTRDIARTWLTQASRCVRVRTIVQPLIQQAKGTECQICLSRNLLQVEPLRTIQDIVDMFQEEHGDDFDQVLMKRFWQRHQRYQTICLPCVQKRNSKEREQIITDDRSSDGDSDGELVIEGMSKQSESILAKWYASAKRNVNRV